MKRFVTIAGVILIGMLVVSPLLAQSSGRGRSRGVPTHTVRVQSNVPGAQLSIDGVGNQGALPQDVSLRSGDYTFRVSAPGYRDWSLSVQIDRDQNLVANLEPVTYTLTVNANVTAQVLVDGQSVGNTQVRRSLSPGTYDVLVRAPGYLDFTTSVALNQDRTINAQLQPANARVSIQIPRSMIPRDLPGAEQMLTVFVDGRPVVGNTFEVAPGRHTVRVRSGGLEIEFTRDFSAGGSYTLVPSLTVQIQ